MLSKSLKGLTLSSKVILSHDNYVYRALQPSLAK